MSKDVNKSSNNDAADYEEYFGQLIFEPSAKVLLSHIDNIPAGSILEIACGTGRVTKYLRKSFPASQLIATDISADMLETGKEQLNDPSIIFQLEDAQDLSFPDQTFDLVVNQFGLMFLSDKEKGMREVFRVLKPGGHFAFTTWDRTANMPLIKLVIDDTIMPLFEGEDTDRFYTASSLHNPDQLNTFLKQAGFTDYRVTLIKYKGRANSPQQIVQAYFLKHKLGREVKERFPGSFDSTANELEMKLIQQFGPGPFEFELSAFLGIGKK